MRILVHHHGPVALGVRLAIANERYHRRTNDPPYRPVPLGLSVSYVSCNGPHDYGDSLAAAWERGKGFVNLEQDVAPWPGALSEIWSCPEDWCALPLIVHQAVNTTNLGCVKFGARFIASHPDLWSEYPRDGVWDWRSLDSWLYSRVGAPSHRHDPPAIHLNPAHL